MTSYELQPTSQEVHEYIHNLIRKLDNKFSYINSITKLPGVDLNTGQEEIIYYVHYLDTDGNDIYRMISGVDIDNYHYAIVSKE